MDVTCERCGTEYEFDETLVSERGTTVKCTHCGHLFKVFRPGGDPDTPGSPRTWTVRGRDGKTQTLGSLRELQRLITEGRLSEADQISRTGETWKPLGDIAELRTFFSAAKASRPPSQPPRRDRTLRWGISDVPGPMAAGSPRAPAPQSIPDYTEDAPTVVNDRPLPAEAVPPAKSHPSSRPPPTPSQARRPPMGKGTVLGMGAAPTPSSRPPARGPAARPPTRPYATDSSRPSSAPPAASVAGAATRRASSQPPTGIQTPRSSAPPPTGPPRARGVSSQPPPGAQTRRAGSLPPPSTMPAAPAPTGSRKGRQAVDEPTERHFFVDEAAEAQRSRPKQANGWVLAVLVLALAAGLAFGYERLHHLWTPEVDSVAPFLERGNEALGLDHPEAYRAAIREYTRATAVAESDVRVLAALSRTHAALAQALAFRAEDVEARVEDDPAARVEALALRTEAEQHATDGRSYGEAAVRMGPADVPALIALAATMRVSQDPTSAIEHLDRARSLEQTESADLRYVGALMAMDASGFSAAIEEVEKAIAIDPHLLRARLLLARAHLHEGDVAGATQELDAVLSRVPSHPTAQDLKRAIAEGLPPAAPIATVADGGVAPDAGTEQDAGVLDVAESDPPSEREVASSRDTATPRGGPAGSAQAAAPRGHDYSWYVQRGDERLEHSDVGRARAMFEAALEVRPGGPEAITGLGFVALETGNASAATRQFRQAANTGHADAYIGLGDAYRRLGEVPRAIESYRAYLALSPTGPSAYLARRQLELLQASSGATPEPQPSPPEPAPGGGVPPESPSGPEDSPTAPSTPPQPAPAQPSPETPPADLPGAQIEP